MSSTPKARSFEYLIETALVIAKKWEWSDTAATHLGDNLAAYFIGAKPFDSPVTDNTREWWANLYISTDECPLKSMAYILLGLTPHAADVTLELCPLLSL